MQKSAPHPLIAIVGPTAAGKSGLALELARRFEGEIVNGDSRLVYRHMDIGTAKPSQQELGLVPHHLVNIADPDDTYSLALYLDQASQAIRDIHGRSRLPFLVGGTGQYVRALLEGFSAPQVPPNPSLRAELQRQAVEEGSEALWRRLQEVDIDSAARIDHRNVRRVVRALEVYQETGVPFSQARSREKPPYNTLMIGLSSGAEGAVPAYRPARGGDGGCRLAAGSGSAPGDGVLSKPALNVQPGVSGDGRVSQRGLVP